MSKSKSPSPNDQRSDVKNSNNASYEADRDNRIELGHPDVPPPPPRPADDGHPRR